MLPLHPTQKKKECFGGENPTFQESSLNRGGDSPRQTRDKRFLKGIGYAFLSFFFCCLPAE